MKRHSPLLFTCRDMSHLLSDGMDRTLPFHTRLRMRLHLLICVLCRRYKQQLALIRNVLRKNGTTLIDDTRANAPGLAPEAKARIQRALDSRRS
ncbi:MAG: zf-HC2 domain-containing protein [Nitrospira sp.]|nr:zf-HC2 domain-containing protein [Nitrospira sp.]